MKRKRLGEILKDRGQISAASLPQLFKEQEGKNDLRRRGYEIMIRPPDISSHGMFVNTSTHFPEGTVVNFRFRLTRSNAAVQTRGEVRNCLPGIGIKIEFVGLGVEFVRAIEKEVRSFSRPRHPK
jgi:hypothetical protein